MTEAEYEKLVVDGAKTYADSFTPSDDEDIDWARHIRRKANFTAGVKWSRTHPPPEVAALVKVLEGFMEWYAIRSSEHEVSKLLVSALARFKERSKE